MKLLALALLLACVGISGFAFAVSFLQWLQHRKHWPLLLLTAFGLGGLIVTVVIVIESTA